MVLARSKGNQGLSRAPCMPGAWHTFLSFNLCPSPGREVLLFPDYRGQYKTVVKRSQSTVCCPSLDPSSLFTNSVNLGKRPYLPVSQFLHLKTR